MKEKDMILSDFLSRLNNDTSDSHEMIPILFSMQEVLHVRLQYTLNGHRKHFSKLDCKLRLVVKHCMKYMV